MGKEKKEFFVGDRVFAKVRGYPPWPARVQEVLNPGTKQVRYNIFFYGTYERAILKPDDIFAYEKNKERFGSLQKRRSFNDGMDEIENNPLLQGPPIQSPSIKPMAKPVKSIPRPSHEDSEEEGKLIIDEEERKQRKRKLAESAEIDMAMKKIKKVSVGKASSSPQLTEEPIQISRSGRKIKPKRFDDDFSSMQNNKGRYDETDEMSSYSQDKKTRSADESSLDSSPHHSLIMSSSGESDDNSSSDSGPDNNLKTFSNNDISPVEASESASSKVQKSLDLIENGNFPNKLKSSVEGANKMNGSLHDDKKNKIKLPVSKEKKEGKLEGKPKNHEKRIHEIDLFAKATPFSDKNRSRDRRQPLIEQKQSNKETGFQSSHKGDENTNQDIKGRGKTLSVRAHCGEIVDIVYDEDRPEKFESEEARIQWDMATAKNLFRLRQQIESGEYVPPELSSKLAAGLLTKQQEKQEKKKKKLLEKKRSLLKWLRCEERLVYLDKEIRSSLQQGSETDSAKCLMLMQDLLDMTIAPLMLIKNPEVVVTIRKCMNYSKNTSIRRKAEELYNSFRSLFTVPDNSTFWNVFLEHVEQFHERTKDMSENLRLLLTRDPQCLRTKHEGSDSDDELDMEELRKIAACKSENEGS